MEHVWWMQITNAHRFIEKIIEALLEEKSLILSAARHLPWRETVKHLVEEGAGAANCNRAFRFVAAEEVPKGDLGEYLLRRFCKPELQAKFRPGRGGYAKFLADVEGCTLADAYVWLSPSTPQQVKQWVDFIGDYHSALGKRLGGVFILDVPDGVEAVGKKGIRSLSYEAEVGTYDCFVFNMLLASEQKGDPYSQQYLAELVSHIVEDDIELSAECVKRGEAFVSDPYNVYVAEAEALGVKPKSAYEVEQCVWVTQIKLVFPLIEEYRRRFVRKRENYIKGSLPVESNGYWIKDPKEAEIGVLHYLASKDQWLLTPKEWEDLQSYHSARNSLAHMHVLSVEQLKKIFQNA